MLEINDVTLVVREPSKEGKILGLRLKTRVVKGKMGSEYLDMGFVYMENYGLDDSIKNELVIKTEDVPDVIKVLKRFIPKTKDKEPEIVSIQAIELKKGEVKIE